MHNFCNINIRYRKFLLIIPHCDLLGRLRQNEKKKFVFKNAWNCLNRRENRKNVWKIVWAQCSRFRMVVPKIDFFENRFGILSSHEFQIYKYHIYYILFVWADLGGHSLAPAATLFASLAQILVWYSRISPKKNFFCWAPPHIRCKMLKVADIQSFRSFCAILT